MLRARAALLMAVGLLMLGGCPLFNIRVPDSLPDVVDDITRPQPDGRSARVSLRVENRSIEAVNVQIRMTIDEQVVNFVSVRMASGANPLLVGPDAAALVSVEARNVRDGVERLSSVFRANDDFTNGEIILLVIEDEDAPVRPAPPVVICPADLTVPCGAALDLQATGVPIAEGDCPGEFFASFSDTVSGNGCQRMITRLWSVRDECDNVVTCTQVITIVDSAPPILTCPPDLPLGCLTSSDPSITGFATAVDACEGREIDVTYSDVVQDGVCGSILRTWRAVDDCGNATECVQTLSYERPDPELACPPDVTLACDADPDPSQTGTATASSECGEVTVTFSDEADGEGCSRLIVRTWTATDACGYRTICEQVIRFADPPAIACPPDVTLECGSDVDPSITGVASATSDCGEVEVTFSDEWSDEGCPVTITRTWTAVDACGASSSCEQVIRLVASPLLTCPPNAWIECGDSTDPELTGAPEVVDRCGSGLSVTFSDLSEPRNPGQYEDPNQVVERITRTWTVVDGCGFEESCNQIIRVRDTTAPLLTCPDDVTVDCEDDYGPDVTGFPDVVDCDPNVIVGYFDFADPNQDCYPQCGPDDCFVTILRYWYAYDRAGNYSECRQRIERVDLVPPIIICPPDTEVVCGESTEPVQPPQIDCDAAEGPESLILPGEFDDENKFIGFVATATIGDSIGRHGDPNSNLPEVTLSRTANGPFEEGERSDFPWISDERFNFTLLYEPDENEVIFVLDGETVVRHTPDPSTPLKDIYIRAYSPGVQPGQATVRVAGLLLDQQFVIKDALDAGGEEGPVNVLRITCADLENGFRLSGNIILTFDPNDVELNGSGLGVQFMFGVFEEPLGTGVPEVFDAVDPQVQVEYTDEFFGECDLIERTWTATDFSGNQSSCKQLIHILVPG